MPMVDMPVSELKKYHGINPRPADFDKYWERALGEMNSKDPECSIIPADFQIKGFECFDLYFNGVRNCKVHCKLIKPANANNAPALLKFHGYGANSGSWIENIKYAAPGFVVASLDCRGQFGYSDNSSSYTGTNLRGQIIRGLSDECADNMYFRHVFLDTAMMAKIVMNLPYVNKDKVCAYGCSQGGGLTVACAALVPEIKKAAPVYPFLCDYKRVWEMDLLSNAYGDIKDYFRFYDPRHEREDQIFERLGYIDLQFFAHSIKAEVLMCTGLLDITCPPSTQFAMYNKITSKKNVLIYPDFAHEGLNDYEDKIMEFFSNLL